LTNLRQDHTFLSDLDVIFMTAIALYRGANRSIPENLLTWGPLARYFPAREIFLVMCQFLLFCGSISG